MTSSSRDWGYGFAVSLAILAGTAVILFVMGRELICTCGTVKLWHGQVVSSENSQHLADWYTPSHVIHGLLFFGAFWLLNRFTQLDLSVGTRLTLSTLLEAAWEIAENTDAVIQRYREATIALDYFGDSVVNSSADIAAMWLGFAIAARWPWWVSAALFVVFEAVTIWLIRDGLMLNVLMLLYPLDVVRVWQGG